MSQKEKKNDVFSLGCVSTYNVKSTTPSGWCVCRCFLEGDWKIDMYWDEPEGNEQ